MRVKQSRVLHSPAFFVRNQLINFAPDLADFAGCTHNYISIVTKNW